MGKIKVVWICNYSNEKVRKHLHFQQNFIENKIRYLFHKQNFSLYTDYGIWITNAIQIFEKFGEIELHVISPHINLHRRLESFVENGIFYYFFYSKDDRLLARIVRKIFRINDIKYTVNRTIINDIIRSVSPDIINIIGAENPQYSLAALDVPKSIPLLVSLQTLMSDPEFFKNYSISRKSYIFRSRVERAVITRADYIGTSIAKFRNIILHDIKPDAIFVNTRLAVGESIDTSYTYKKYNFVYFAADISKACDYAIEAFAIAFQMDSSITLNVVGGYSKRYKALIDKRLEELGITNNVVFSGSLLTHEDVLKQIKCARFALLPLKIDIISGTIREAMACGLPLITTITTGTPELNSIRESVLLSPVGDHQAMADNMLRLLKSDDLANRIQQNAIKTLTDTYDNNEAMKNLLETYKAIIKRRILREPIPKQKLAKKY